jgi:hypothetical protein
VVGRIFKAPVAPPDRPWMWASRHNGDIKRAAHGYEPTREAAMAAFVERASDARLRGSPNSLKQRQSILRPFRPKKASSRHIPGLFQFKK